MEELKIFENNKLTMSSREIAELTGKRHSDVLEAIRAMEPAWEKIAGRKFPLGSYLDSNNQERPMYELNKTECLYVATKFNDESRAILVLRWEELESKQQYGTYHLNRYSLNCQKIPHGYFSMVNEIYITLIRSLEYEGVLLPDNMIPDISEGKLFCKYLRNKGIDTNNFPTYDHQYPNGKIVRAKLYPNEYLSDFKDHFALTWMKDRAIKYFNDRSPDIIPYLNRVIKNIEEVNNKYINNN